ncbi:unnamed protein product [Trichogramma brassicae]|uniref:Uncharacterized protein n=1 Tax=Trichogramma brassicae TaxID=86971 RepID=A0A6H5I325_9HYME|nr:unnamed protein product [Trichogramma brassicae]
MEFRTHEAYLDTARICIATLCAPILPSNMYLVLRAYRTHTYAQIDLEYPPCCLYCRRPHCNRTSRLSSCIYIVAIAIVEADARVQLRQYYTYQPRRWFYILCARGTNKSRTRANRELRSQQKKKIKRGVVDGIFAYYARVKHTHSSPIDTFSRSARPIDDCTSAGAAAAHASARNAQLGLYVDCAKVPSDPIYYASSFPSCAFIKYVYVVAGYKIPRACCAVGARSILKVSQSRERQSSPLGSTDSYTSPFVIDVPARESAVRVAHVFVDGRRHRSALHYTLAHTIHSIIRGHSIESPLPNETFLVIVIRTITIWRPCPCKTGVLHLRTFRYIYDHLTYQICTFVILLFYIHVRSTLSASDAFRRSSRLGQIWLHIRNICLRKYYQHLRKYYQHVNIEDHPMVPPQPAAAPVQAVIAPAQPVIIQNPPPAFAADIDRPQPHINDPAQRFPPAMRSWDAFSQALFGYQPTLPEYRGLDHEDPRQFLARCEEYIASYNLPEHQQVRTIEKGLKDSAENWFLLRVMNSRGSS